MNELIELGVVAGQQNPEDQGVGGELIELGSVVSKRRRTTTARCGMACSRPRRPDLPHNVASAVHALHAPLLRFRRRSA